MSMNKAQVEKEAHKVEGLARDVKDADALSHELHGLKPKDRIAVMHKIQDDVSKHKVNLPGVDFFESGDLKSFDTKSDDGKSSQHIGFDQKSGNRRVVDSHDYIGDSHKTYDTVSGKLTVETIAYSDGTLYTGVHAPITGKLLVEDTKWTRGQQARHLEYDDDERLTQSDYIDRDGTRRHSEYQKHEKVDEVVTDPKGNKVETIWDPDTRKIVVVDVTNTDRSGSFSKFDPKDGHLVSIDSRDQNGTLTHWRQN